MPLPTHVEAEIKYMDATGDLQAPGCLTPCPSSPPGQGFFQTDISQGTGPWELLAPVIFPPHALPEKINSCFPSLLQIPVCASCPMVHGHCQAGGWRSGGHTHSQQATAARMHNSKLGSNWVRCLLIGPAEERSSSRRGWRGGPPQLRPGECLLACLLPSLSMIRIALDRDRNREGCDL